MKSLNQIKHDNELADRFDDAQVTDAWDEMYTWVLDAVGDESDRGGILLQTFIEQMRLWGTPFERVREAMAEVEACEVDA